MGFAKRMADKGPAQVDEYRVGECFGTESQVHFETKLEIQHWLHRTMISFGAPQDAYFWVEWVYPWSRVRQGEKFSWFLENRVFDENEWLDVNDFYVPTVAAAIKYKYKPKFVFDIACESARRLHGVIEVVCGNPVEPEKRAFCRGLGVPLYEIDAERFAPQFAERHMYTYTDREYVGEARTSLPLVGGGELSVAELCRRLFV